MASRHHVEPYPFGAAQYAVDNLQALHGGGVGQHLPAVDVAYGVNAGHVGEQVVVGDYALRAVFHPGGLKVEPCCGRRAAHGHKHAVGFDGGLLALAVECHGAVAHGLHGRLHEEGHAALLYGLAQSLGHIAVEGRQALFEKLNHGDLATETVEYAGKLHAYNAGAHYADTARQLGGGQHTVGRPYHRGVVDALYRQHLWHRTGGYDDVGRCVVLAACRHGVGVLEGSLAPYERYARCRQQRLNAAAERAYHAVLALGGLCEVETVVEAA